MLDVLHVAALPFPTAQGTQAAVAAMVRGSVAAGARTGLLTYAHGDPSLVVDLSGAEHLRGPRWPGSPRSLRSGPSPAKLVGDVALGRALRAALGSRRPGLVIAHHVEAAAVALLHRRPGGPRVVFVAHTSLRDELPGFLPAGLRGVTRWAGWRADGALVRHVDEVLAVSPDLARRLPGGRARYAPIPWPVDDPSRRPSRAEARRSLGLPAADRLVLYAGNLDDYQGWEDVPGALAALPSDRSAGWLLGTASDAAPAIRAARDAGLPPGAVHVRGLGGEVRRAALHAAADVVAIPRRVPGGVPIKLLDALARAAPVAATPRALSGLAPPDDAVAVAASDDHPGSLAAALAELLDLPDGERRARGARGRRWLSARHRPVDAAPHGGCLVDGPPTS